MELGRYRDAAAHLSFFLRETRELAEVGAAERANAERLLARARAHVGTLIIVVEPAGADVLIDGVVVGRAPLVDPVFVSPGWRSVDVRRDGYRATGEAREVVSGGTARFELHMAPVADSGPPAVPSAAPTADAVPPPVSNTAAIAAVPSMATSTPLPQARGWRGVDTGVVIGGTLATAALSGLGVWFGSKVSANIDEQKHCAGGNDQCDFTRAGTPAGKFGRLQEDLAGQKQVRSWLFGGAALVAAGTLTYAIVMPRLSQPAKVTATAGPGGVSTTFVMTW